VADLNFLRRAVDMKGELSSPFAVRVGTAPGGLTYLESWPHGLNLNSFFYKNENKPSSNKHSSNKYTSNK
jgi:hypothetical protein